jgi:hypothetical protein
MKTFNTLLIFILICPNINILDAQNAPIATIDEVTTSDTIAVVPITVTGFSNISVCDLTLNYNPEIATVSSVSLGPGVMQTFFIPDFETPGTILLSWFYFQGLTIPNDSVFINITFERVNYGFSAIGFDNSLPDNCLWADVNSNTLNDVPNSTYYIDGSVAFEMINAPITSAPVIEACQGTASVDMPVIVSDFNQIGAFTLTMQYDASVFSYQSFTNNSGFPDLEVTENSPGTIVAEGLSLAPEGFSLTNNSTLFTIHFDNQGGSTVITWLDLGESCQYMSPAPVYEIMNDSPQYSYYINGSFTELPVPSPAGTIEGPSGGTVCQGESGVIFSVEPISFANSYEWTLPEGATIESGDGTPEISVSFSDNAVSGDVSVYGINECGDGTTSPLFPLVVDISPYITTQPVSPETVYAGDGTALFSIIATGSDLVYQWQENVEYWTDLTDNSIYSGTQSSVLTITDPPVTMNGNHYRCIVSGSCEPPAISDGNAVLSVVLNTGFDKLNYQENTDDLLKFGSYPNPFSDAIAFTYFLPSKGRVVIKIANIYGQEIAVLADQIESKGNHLLQFNAMKLITGFYMAVITFYGDKDIIISTHKIISNNK